MPGYAKTVRPAASYTNRLKRQPFNDQNPSGPLELCTCATCGKPIMLDFKYVDGGAVLPSDAEVKKLRPASD